MNQTIIRSFFRGGGLICSTQIPQDTSFQDESIIDQDIIRDFFLDLEGKCSTIGELSNSIQSQESQDNIIKIIKSISCQSQFINQASRNYAKAREQIKQLLTDLEILLDCITNTIISQRFISLQILKICNQISRLIFQYYANDQSTPLDQERQQSILAIINQIEELLNQGGEQLYYNSIQYELFIIKICIEICPTNSEEGKEVLLSIISGIQASLEELSTDLLTALAQGGLYAYKEIKKRKQRNMFKIIFYLEEFKYKIIEKIQQGQGINKIIKQLVNNYNILIKNSHEWLIKCSWIKIISELIVYKPIITQKQFQNIKNKHQLQTEWDSLIQKRIIKLVDDKQNIAIIQQNDENSNTNRILQQQIIKFLVLQNYIINAEKNLPKLEQLKEFSNSQQDTNTQLNNLAIEQLQNLPIGQFIQQLNEYSQQIIKYVELVQDFAEEIDNKNTNKSYLLQQIEQIIIESDIMRNIGYQLILHNNIIYDVLGKFIKDSNVVNIQINVILNQIIQYFEISKISEYTYDDLISEFQTYTNILQIQYKFDGQTLDKINNIQLIQFTKVDQLILKLQEIIINDKNLKTLDEISFYLKFISVIAPEIQQSRETLTTYEIVLFNIRSLINNNHLKDEIIFTQMQQLNPQKPYFQQMFHLYSNVANLKYVYQYINDNQQVIITNILNAQSSDINLQLIFSTLQYNNRVEDIVLNLQTTYQLVSSQFKKLLTLNDKIQYLNVLEYVFINTDKKSNTITQDLIIQSKILEQIISTQQQQNPYNNTIDQIAVNYNQLSQDIDAITFIDLIQKRIELLRQLQKLSDSDKNLIIYIDLLQLIIEDTQQKYQNIQRQEVIQIIKQQQDKLMESTQVDKQSENIDQAGGVILYKQYIQAMQEIVQEINFNKLKENTSNLLHDITNMMNYAKLQKYLKKELDEDKQAKFNSIHDNFQKLFEIDLGVVQMKLRKQFQSLKSQEKKLSIEDLKIIIPSYQQLSDRVLDNNKKLSIKQKALQFIDDQLTSDVWRIKDYLYFNLLSFHQYLPENNQKVVGQLLLIARFKETDYRIINTLKGKEQIQQMDALINNQWEETQDQVNNELQLTLNELQAIQLSLQSEERKEIRDQLLQKHKNLEQQLEQQMKNVNEIGDVLGVTIYFLKDIKRDLASIQNKLDNIINSIDQIGQDIKFLRGKTPQQILEMRMQSILQNKIYQDAQSVYVQMKILEYDFNTNQEKQDQTPLFNIDNQQNGEIDEFLTENKKSSLLIHGAAGSGKSLTARKIEEYLWLQYQKQCVNKLWSDIKGTPPMIPIFIQLPTLKEPKFNAVEETLLSSLYRFDQKQIDLLKDIAQKNQIRLIFIMDSYDELPQQYQGINLLQTNKIHLWKPQNQIQIPKVITTSRTEAFTTNDYRAWFWENETSGFQSLKELRLLPFDDSQRQDYLKQFSILKFKISIYDLLQVIARNQDKNQILQDTNDICQQFEQYLQISLKQENKQFLLDQNYVSILVKIIKENTNVTLFNQEQETSFTKLIINLWHQNLYNNSIQQMNLSSLLETPYMLNIVVEVLPQMNNLVSQPGSIKSYFMKNYIDLTKRSLDSIIKNFEQNPNILGYKLEEIQLFKQYMNNAQQLNQDTYNLWETLIEQQFFSNWNVQSSLEHTITQIEKIQKALNRDIFPIKNSNEEQMIILYKSLKSHKLTLYDFFNQFIEQFVENQRQKLIYSNDILDQNQFEQDIYKYAIRLSILMFQRQETIIERKPQGILFRELNQDPYSQFFEDADQYASYRKQIRKCIPLSQKGNFYQFRHKSIQEFLLSKESFNMFDNAFQVLNLLNEVIKNLRKGNKQLDLLQLQQENNINKQNKSQDDQRKYDQLFELLKSIEISVLNQINLQDTFNLGALRFMKTKFTQESDLCNVLYPLILLSSVNQAYTRFSSNCIVILLQVSEFQTRQDFSKIVISEISIDGAIFENCDLSFSKFDKVSIKGLNLNFSDISNCEWTNLYSNDLPSIQIDGLNCKSQLSPNGQQILSFSDYSQKSKNKIQIWDSKNGNQLGLLEGHLDMVQKALFTHDSNFIISYGKDAFIRQWNVQNFTQIKEHKLKGEVQSLIISDDDEKIAYYFQDKICIINNQEKMDEVVKVKLDSNCFEIKFQNEYIISLSHGLKKIFLQQWNSVSGEMQLEQIQEWNSIYKPQFGCFYKDLLFIASSDYTIGKWDLNEFKTKGSPFKGHASIIECMDISLDGKQLVSGGRDSLIIIYDVKSCNKISTIIGHRGKVNSVQFSPDHKYIISCSDDRYIRYWDAKVNKQQENSSFIYNLLFTHDSNQIIYSNNRRQIIFNDTQTGQQINEKITENMNSVLSMCLHPNGKYLLYTTGWLTKIYDLRLIKQVGKTKQTDREVFKVGYSSDGSKIFLAFYENLIIYDPQNWNQLNNYHNEGAYQSTQLSSNYEYIMHYHTNNTINLIEFKTQNFQQIQNNKNISTFDLGYNNKIFVAVEEENFIVIWDLSQKESQPKKIKTKLESSIKVIKISPDSIYIFVGAYNGEIYLINSQKEYAEMLIASCQSQVKEIIISPNQRYLTAIANDPILNVLQIDEKGQQTQIYSKYNIPQRLSFQTLIQDIKFENSIITSHLGYDLKTTFTKKMENEKNQSL